MVEESDWRTLRRDGIELAYVCVGGGDRTVVLLHGLAGYALEWQGTIEALSRASYRVIAPDQRGHGRSTRRPASVTRGDHVEDVVAMIEREHAGPVDLVGQSMGANTAMLVAAERPDLVRRLVLVEGGVGGGGPEATAPMAKWLRGWPAPFADRDAFAEFFGGPEQVAFVWAAGLGVAADGLWPRWDADVLADSLAHVHRIARWNAWRRVAAPTLIVRGERGELSLDEAQQMVERGRDARVVTVEAAGHDLHLEVQDAWLRELRAFLTG